MRPTVEDAKRLQASRDIEHLHLVWLDSQGFVIAHTGYERRSKMDLETCSLHRYLVRLNEQPFRVVAEIVTPLTGWCTVDLMKSFEPEFEPLYGMCKCGSIQPHLSGDACRGE